MNPMPIAKRMFYQCQDGNLICNEVRDLMPNFTITEILKKCAKYKRMSFKDMTVILIIDGMQNALTNDNDTRDKNSAFYSFFTELYAVVINNNQPLIIACCTAIFSQIKRLFYQ